LPPALLKIIATMVPVALRLLADLLDSIHIKLFKIAFRFPTSFLINSSLPDSFLVSRNHDCSGRVGRHDSSSAGNLALNLPKACNYFFFYTMMYAVATTVSIRTQASGLINMFVLFPILDATARQKWIRRKNLNVQK
jgi:hypothetical protein